MATLLVLFAAVVFAAGIYGMVHAAFRYIVRKPVPKGTLPLVVGVSMFGFYLTLDYSWPGQERSKFAEDWVEVDQVHERNWWRPWTYVAPRTVGLIVLDAGETVISPTDPRYRVAVIYQNYRLIGSSPVGMVLDCEAAQASPLQGLAPFGEDGLPLDPMWRPVHPEDPVFPLVCGAPS